MLWTNSALLKGAAEHLWFWNKVQAWFGVDQGSTGRFINCLSHKCVDLETKTQYVYWLNQQSGQKWLLTEARSSGGWGQQGRWLCFTRAFPPLPQAGATVVSDWNAADWIWSVWERGSGVSENHQGRTLCRVCLYCSEGKAKSQAHNWKLNNK